MSVGPPMNGAHFAIYLLPDPATNAAIRDVQIGLRREFGVAVALRLPVHVTVKGFFDTNAAEQDLLRAFDSVSADAAHLPVLSVDRVVDYHSTAIAAQVGRGGTRLQLELDALHRRVLPAFMPLVSESCDFSRDEWTGDRWDPHITLAAHDVDEAECSAIVEAASALMSGQELRLSSLGLVLAQSNDWARWWEDIRITPLRTAPLD